MDGATSHHELRAWKKRRRDGGKEHFNTEGVILRRITFNRWTNFNHSMDEFQPRKSGWGGGRKASHLRANPKSS